MSESESESQSHSHDIDALSVSDPSLNNKPDFRHLHLGSPISPLLPTAATSTSTSTSSGSLNCRSDACHSGELSASASLTSPPLPLPAGNICPSGRILTTGMATARPSRTDVLGSGTGNYGHGSIMRSSVAPPKAESAPANTRRSIGDPEELKKAGNDKYRKGQFLEAMGLYDKAISISPRNAAYRSNRAAALTGLGRIAEAVRECQAAVSLDANYCRPHQRLASLFIR